MFRNAIVAGVAVLIALGLLATRCNAQVHIDFGVGHGHHHHHHHDHGFHSHFWPYYGWYGDYWYDPPVRYVYAPPPQTVIYTQPGVAVAQPAPAAAGMATSQQSPRPAANRTAARSNSLPAEKGRGVTIRNPDASGGSVSFMVDGESEWQLEEGQAKTLNGKSTYIVEFDRGGDFGAAKREVTAGQYQFVVTESGWDLEREKDAQWRSALNPGVRKNALPGTRR